MEKCSSSIFGPLQTSAHHQLPRGGEICITFQEASPRGGLEGAEVWWGPRQYGYHGGLYQGTGRQDHHSLGTHGGSGVSSYARVIKEYYPNANVLESLGISGSSIRNASAKTTVENWLKRLGIDKQTTAVRSISTHLVGDGDAYSLTGQRYNGQRGIYIKNGK